MSDADLDGEILCSQGESLTSHFSKGVPQRYVQAPAMATQIVIYYVLVEPLYQQMTLLDRSKSSKINKLIQKGYWMDHFSYSYKKRNMCTINHICIHNWQIWSHMLSYVTKKCYLTLSSVCCTSIYTWDLVLTVFWNRSWTKSF